MACAKGLIITLLGFYMFTAILGKQSCVSPDGQEAWDKNTKLYTSDCSKECTCVGEGEYFCEDLCPVQIAHCNVGYVARFKTIKISKRGRECRCDEFDKCVKNRM
ncbi:uncharacterized protein [Pocillopora verrucosa]|uniref:uncharacterized protein n=1 Tax=Pocillopora verrucosa TaxID=203993 RepID=UPI00333F2F38